MKRILTVAALAVAAALPAVGLAQAEPSISPEHVEATLYPGQSLDVDKTVGTAEIPPKVDVCLLEDETGSFDNDIANLQNPATTLAIYNGVTSVAPDSQFAVAGFRDFGDAFVYRLLQTMDPTLAAWQAGVGALSADGGGDEPEAQYPAIRAAVDGGFDQGSCGFRADPLVARVLVVATDAPFHVGGAYGDLASTTAVLTAANVTVIGLKAPGAGIELDALAAATGGTVQALAADGANIASAILEGLGNLPVEVEMSSDCTAPISTSFTNNPQSVTSGDNALFTETISVAAGTAGGTYECTDYVSYNGVLSDVTETKTIHVPGLDLTPVTDINELGFDVDHTVTATVTAGDAGPLAGADVTIEITAGPNAGETISAATDANGEVSLTWTPSVEPSSLGTDDIVATLYDPDGNPVASDTADKEWVDTTPPTATCDPTVNPAGKNIPKAPGNGGQGQNQDGFYQLNGSDVVWPAESLEAYVIDNGTGTIFGPFAIGTNIKYTQSNGVPSQKKMGNSSDAVAWHIKGQGDAVLQVVDGSDNVDFTNCLVPPTPK